MYLHFNMRKSSSAHKIRIHIIWLALVMLLQSNLVWGDCRSRCRKLAQEEYINTSLYKNDLNDDKEELSLLEAMKLSVRHSYLACAVPQGALAMFNQRKSSRCLLSVRKRCESDCRRLIRLKKITLNSNKTSPWSFGETTFDKYSGSLTENKSLQIGSKKSEWHCLCYFEKYKGEFRRSTACRQSARACWRLYGKIQVGTRILMKNSQYMGCSIVSGEHPAMATSSPKRYWKQSKRSGSYWSPRGCFLNQNLKLSEGEAIPYR